MKSSQTFVTNANPTVGKPQIAIAMGDPAGIGPEVILKAFTQQSWHSRAETTIFGSRALLEKTYQQLKSQGVDLVDPDALNVWEIEVDSATLKDIHFGQENAASGEISFVALESAIAQTLAGKFQGIVTAPIAKSAWKAAGHHYPGQTELLAEKAGVEKFGMLFVARSPQSGWILRTLLATTHIPLRQVPEALNPNLMSAKLDLLIQCLRQDFGLQQGKIAIAGLNPHSGEQGQLGQEEVQWLNAWLNEARATYPDWKLEGLIPPDTMWVKPGQAWNGAIDPALAHDGYLALYHDQGLIPVKLMAFDRAVNTSIGLPFVRTSPDHGTAFDIAGKGIAQATSMIEALQLAIDLVRNRVGCQ